MITTDTAAHLVPLDWSTYAGASPFSVIWRTARASCLSHRALKTLLRVPERPPNCSFGFYLFSANVGKALAKAPWAVPQDIAKYWEAAAWWTFSGDAPPSLTLGLLRLCPHCARSAYHSYAFQAPDLATCPWHQCPLVSTCPGCGSDAFQFEDVSQRWGACACGADLVDGASLIEGQSLHRELWLDDYTTQCAHQRSHRYLIAPPFEAPLRPLALEALMNLQPGDGGGLPARCLVRFAGGAPTLVRHPLVVPAPEESDPVLFHRLPSDWAPTLQAAYKRWRTGLRSSPLPAPLLKKALDLLGPVDVTDVSLIACTFHPPTVSAIRQLSALCPHRSPRKQDTDTTLPSALADQPELPTLALQALHEVVLAALGDCLRTSLLSRIPSLKTLTHYLPPSRRNPWLLVALDAANKLTVSLAWSERPERSIAARNVVSG